ncbi:hypothetical protein GBAR_LOCUS25676, partial [Geodia barretti]
YTAVISRNITRIIFELSVDRDGQNTQTILPPVSFPLIPAQCACDTFPPFFEDSYCDSYDINCKSYGVRCEGDIIDGFKVDGLDLDPCDSPPSVTLQIVFKGTPFTVVVSGNTTSELLGSATLTATVWYYDYSMDMQVDFTSDGINRDHTGPTLL